MDITPQQAIEQSTCGPVYYMDITPQQAIEQYQNNRNRPVVSKSDLTWSLPVKKGSFQVFGHRVGNIAARKAGIRPDKM